MSDKAVKTRIQLKHDFEARWNEAKNFTPLEGELIIYDAEADSSGNAFECTVSGRTQKAYEFIEGRMAPYAYPRFKVGDGVTVLSDLPFLYLMNMPTTQVQIVTWDSED